MQYLYLKNEIFYQKDNPHY